MLSLHSRLEGIDDSEGGFTASLPSTCRGEAGPSLLPSPSDWPYSTVRVSTYAGQVGGAQIPLGAGVWIFVCVLDNELLP